MFYKILEFQMGAKEFRDITQDIADIVSHSGIKNGLVLLFTQGSTSALITIENEPGLLNDFSKILDKIVPKNANYEHNKIDNNATSHLLSSILGCSLAIPLVEGKLFLGTWQQIFLINCDLRPRKRKILIQIIF
ncbi:MAG: secondary thiamine-phosphate synthase enzyme YjbQ [Candidatus Aenigmatarchaeota archaeon]